MLPAGFAAGGGDGRDQGLGPARPGRHPGDWRACRGRRGLHPERVRGRAGPPLAAHLRATAPEGHGGYGWAEAIVSTSGCANAATGPAGDADQLVVAEALAAAAGVAVERTLLLSTGVIGTRLPLDRVRAGLAGLVPAGLLGHRRRARGRGRRPADDRLPDEGRHGHG